jgi:hypothetical protein
MIRDESARVLEVTSKDLIRYLEHDDRMPIALGTVFEDIKVEFRYHLDTDAEHYSDAAYVLSARSIKKLVEMGAVRYTYEDTNTTILLVLCEDQRDDDLRDRLKEAFHAHEEHTFGGKDPRRVWRDFEAE